MARSNMEMGLTETLCKCFPSFDESHSQFSFRTKETNALAFIDVT